MRLLCCRMGMKNEEKRENGRRERKRVRF